MENFAYVGLGLAVVVGLYVAYAVWLGFTQMSLIEQLVVALGVLGWVHEIAPGLWAAAIAGAVSWGACTAVRLRAHRRGAIALYRDRAADRRDWKASTRSDTAEAALADEIAIGLGAIEHYLREESER